MHLFTPLVLSKLHYHKDFPCILKLPGTVLDSSTLGEEEVLYQKQDFSDNSFTYYILSLAYLP